MKRSREKVFDLCISCKGEYVGEYDDGIICADCGTCQACHQETREKHVCAAKGEDQCFRCHGCVALYKDGIICGDCGRCQVCKRDAGNMDPGHICQAQNQSPEAREFAARSSSIEAEVQGTYSTVNEINHINRKGGQA